MTTMLEETTTETQAERWRDAVTFWVPGIPRPGGSKKGFYIPKLKRVVITDDAKGNADWKRNVSFFARQAFEGDPLIGDLKLIIKFYLTRPDGHFGSGKNAGIVKASAPRFPAKKPDVLKLARSTEDAMTGIIYRDDAQIVREILSKDYAAQPGARVTVQVLD